MTWNFHRYYNDSADGLISKLKLASEQVAMLKDLRNRVRTRTKEVFEEAKELAKASNAVLSLESLTARVSNTRLKHLDPQAQAEVAMLIKNMDEDARNAFLSLNPRFWTQGSFQYDTLNNPYFTPPQEMDIDDGTYLPMAIFEDQPVIGHRLLLLLVDSSLKSLAYENGWEFEAQPKCARLKISTVNTHIDVPMYAIPEDQFLLKEAALAKAMSMESLDSAERRLTASFEDYSPDYELDEGCVNLAVRDGDQKWIKSDPKIVEDWFKASCKRIGPHLRNVCRFLKSWRDVQWKYGGGPSSISLMAATVNILDRVPHDRTDLGATMRILAKNLPREFSSGVESPDHTDEKPLFPPSHDHGEREKAIMTTLSELDKIMDEAERSPNKDLALATINRAFGSRVIKSDLIDSATSAPAFASEPSRGTQATRISTTMASG